MSYNPRRVVISERLESRCLFNAVSWDGGGDGINWSDPLNWSANQLPGSADDVTVDPTSPTSQLQLSLANVQVNSLFLSADMLITKFFKIASNLELDDATLELGGVAANGNPTGTLSFVGTAMISGTGIINLTGNNGGIFIDNSNLPTRMLTIGADVTIEMTAGSIGFIKPILNGSGAQLVNHGRIEASAPEGTLTVGSYANSSSVNDLFTSDGTLSVDQGAKLELAGTWDSTMPIEAGDGTLSLQGKFSAANVSSIVRTGTGDTLLSGIVDLTQAPLALTEANGPITLVPNGFISGPGTLSTSGTAQLLCTGGVLANGVTISGKIVLSKNTLRTRGAITLDGTIAGTAGKMSPDGGSMLNITAHDGARLSGASILGAVTVADANATLWIDSGLTDADVRLQGADSRVIIDGTQTWTSVDLSFDSSATTSLIIKNAVAGTGVTLTTDINCLIHGRNGIIADDASNTAPASLLNGGTIQADVAGTELEVQPGVLTNNRTLGATSAATLRVSTVPSNYNSTTQTLTGGTWSAAANATLLFPDVIANNAAVLELTGSGSSIPAASSLQVNSGTISLGPSASFDISGDFAQTESGTLRMLVSSSAVPAGAGVLNVSGTATLDGMVAVQFLNFYTPNGTEAWPAVVAQSVVGTFDAVTVNDPFASRGCGMVYSPTTATLRVSPPRPPAPDMSNLDDTGPSSTDNITSNVQPRWIGSVTEGDSARLYLDGQWVASAPIVDGSYTITPPALADGIYSVQIAIADSEGVESPKNNPAEMVIDTTAPTVTAISFDPSGPPHPHAIHVSFSEFVANSLSGEDLVVTNQTTGEVIPGSNLQWNEYIANSTTFTLKNFPKSVLPDGNYTVDIDADDITDQAGNGLATDVSEPFFVLAGDANHDAVVDTTDLGIFAMNWNTTGKTFGQGDFNYDGRVDVADFKILAANWQKTPSGALASSAPMPTLIPITETPPPPSSSARRRVSSARVMSMIE